MRRCTVCARAAEVDKGNYFIYLLSSAEQMGPTTDIENGSKNVIYLLADALRPDYLGCYGNDSVLTTEIDRLAEGGTLFENVVSAAPWTVPSIASHSTGLYPHHLGVYNATKQLADDTPSIYERFKREGYVTGAFLDSKGLEWGDGIDHSGMSLDIQGVLDFISEHSDDQFFMFNLYRGTHLPHVLKYSRESFYEHTEEALDRLRYAENGVEETKKRYTRSVEHFSEWYLRAIIDRLEREGIRDETVIVLTADHGESFGHRFDSPEEIDLFALHGPLLYQEVLKVPLVINNLGSEAGARVEHMVRSVDVLPTVLDGLKIPTQYDGERPLDGTSLSNCLFGRQDAVQFPEYAFSSTTSYENPDGDKTEILSKCSVVSDGWKLIWTPSSSEFELYDLDADSGETTNLVDTRPEIRSELEAVLRAEFEEIDGAYTDEERDAVLDRLEDLGYR